MRIYIAGPYTAANARDVQANVDRAIEVGCALMRMGHTVYIPHLMHYVWLHPDGDFPYEHWIAQVMAWLEQNEALYFIGPSPGATPERVRAEELGLCIFESLETVPRASNE